MSNFYHHRHNNGQQQGFTLVELLVVIVIIGILAGMAFVGGRAAMNAARRAIISKDINEVNMAVETYKQRYGEYPPDFSDSTAVIRHVQKRWPRFNWFNKPQNFETFAAMVKAAGWDFTEETDSHDSSLKKSRAAHIAALAFWLGGLPDTTTGMLGGFSADPSNPLSVSSNGNAFSYAAPSQRELPLMELTDGGNSMVVDNLPVIVSRGMPFVYFKPSASGQYLQRGASVASPLCFQKTDSMTDISWSDLGMAVPYAKKGDTPANAVWQNSKTFQIVHPGLDNHFSTVDAGATPAVFRVMDSSSTTSTGCTQQDEDNQANFGGTTIGSR